MHPADLAHERQRRERLARRRLAVDIRQAALHATPGELADLAQLTTAVRAGAVRADDARAAVLTLRAKQQQRQAA